MKSALQILNDPSNESAELGKQKCHSAESPAEWRHHLAAISIYTTLAIIFFARGLFPGFESHYIGGGADPTQMMWMFEWWPYAIAHRLNLFITDLVWEPVGFNLASMTSIPLLAFIAYPFTRTLGLVAAYNILALMAPAAAALCAYALCRQITGKFWPSLLGGYLFGFSGYMLGELLGHLNLVTVFAFPLAALLTVARFQGKLRRMSFATLLTLTLVAQFLINMEFFATGLLFGAAMLAAIIFYSPAAERCRYYAEVPAICLSIVAATIAVSPYIYYFLMHSRLHQPFWPAEIFSTNLLNFVIPTPTNLLGTGRWPQLFSSHFGVNIIEQGGYVALPVLFIVVFWVRRNWHEASCKALITVLLVGWLATLGPRLQIGGHATIFLPWLALVRVPLLEHALPIRITAITSLLLALIVAMWFAQAKATVTVKGVLALLTVGMMLPNLNAEFWISHADDPEFFSRQYSQYVSPSDVVLALPWGDRGSSMLWQAQCGMCFRNVGGWTGVQRFAVARWPIVNYFMGEYDLEDIDHQFKAFLANNKVNVVVVGNASPQSVRWNELAQSLGVAWVQSGGVSLYRIPSGLLDAYRSMSGLAMESRALRTRFNKALEATDRYLEDGHDPHELSVEQLIKFGLLPASWTPQRKDLMDLYVTARPSGKIAIGEFGSYSAFRTLIESYRARASAIYYPYPQVLWEPTPPTRLMRFLRAVLIPPAAGPVDGESIQMLAVDFTRQQLKEAANAVAKDLQQPDRP